MPSGLKRPVSLPGLFRQAIEQIYAVSGEYVKYLKAGVNMEHRRFAALLVIDDDQVIRETLQRVFSRTYDCDISDGSEHVLENLERRKYDVIITDVSLPGVDGLQILKRAQARHLKTPVIVISGNGDQFRNLFLELGAFAYFTKPFCLEELESAVVQAIESVR
jgi:two-component system, NtrC family, response regulator AtoC